MKKSALIFLILFSSSLNDARFLSFDDENIVDFLVEYLSIKYSDKQFDEFIYVAAKRQKLYYIKDRTILQTYTVSTSRNGIGNTIGTYCTPQGLHEIAEKVGRDLPEGAVIKNKVPTNEIATIITSPKSTSQDLVTTRILHLRGLEDEVNRGGDKDSYNRGIFIHGTHEEGLLGTPASKGCVRMANADIADLFEKVEVGTFVVILNN
jgi:lipoprotein-anchoring transpeptidase ErfK/SrfK